MLAVPAGATPGYSVVASGLANPRGLAFSADGKLYVAEAGQAGTVAVASQGGAFLATAGGCAADGKGNVYISNIFVGSLVKVNLGSMTMSWVRGPGTLNFPAGVAIAKDGSVYVANNGVCPSFPTPASGDPQNPNPCEGVTGSIVRVNP